MLAACAARLTDRSNMIWVDLGGGTGVSANYRIARQCAIVALGTSAGTRQFADLAADRSLHHLQENVDLMSQYIDLSKFKAIYVVDLCHSLCEVAKRKAMAKGWKNVHVVEADACQFAPPEGTATLVTFSYSLTSKLCPQREPICNIPGLTVALAATYACPNNTNSYLVHPVLQ